MVKIDKEVTITITGKDVQTLRNICQLADRAIKEEKEKNGKAFVPENLGLYSTEIVDVRNMIDVIYQDA